MVDAEVQQANKIDDDDPFANISQGNAEIAPPEVENVIQVKYFC